MTRACLLARKARTGGHELQVLPNCWPGQEGRRSRLSWSYKLGLWKFTMKVSESKYTVNPAGGTEASLIQIEYEGIQRNP